jgi:hypothetical protein
MRLAAKRLLYFVLLALSGALSSVAMAGPLDPIGTVTSAISTIAGQTTIVSGVTGGVSGSGSGSGSSGSSDPVSGAVGSVTGSASDLLSGSGATGGTAGTGGTLDTGGTLGTGGTADGSASGAVDGLSGGGGSGGSATGSRPAPGRRTHTRFDRLPRRYEILLERIELGRNVSRNIARLRELLASASPEFRARILRVIRREIHRLEQGGLTRRERLAVRRLHRLLTGLHRTGLPSPARTTPNSAASFDRPGLIGDASRGEVLGATVSHTREAHDAGPREPGGSENGRLPFSPPAPPSGALYWLALALLGTVICALALLALSSQRALPIPMRGALAARAPQLRALGLMMAFVGGLGVYLLVLLA